MTPLERIKEFLLENSAILSDGMVYEDYPPGRNRK